MSNTTTGDYGVDREDIESENVSDLNAADLIRLFSVRLATFNQNHDLSRSRCIGEIATEFRDDYQVNILRVLDEFDYQHPDGFAWNIEPFDEDTIAKFDPVHPESREEGGTADFRAGDVIEIDGDGMVIVGVGDTHFVSVNQSGKIDKHSLATGRELFKTPEIEARLIRDGEVVRGPGSTSEDAG